jgi:hypothetical protein
MGKAAVGLSIVAFIFSIIALASTYWIGGDGTFGGLQVGLWKACDKDGGNCSDVDDDVCVFGNSDSTKEDQQSACRGTRAFAVLFFIFAFLVVVAQFVAAIPAKAKPALAGVAALCGLISMAIYAGSNGRAEDAGYDYGYGFALLIIGWLMEIAVAVINGKEGGGGGGGGTSA